VTKTCSFCHAEVERRRCRRNRYGEYICSACLKQGKRWSRRRTLWRAIKRRRFMALGLLLIVPGIFIFVRVLAYVVAAMESRPDQ
jgi:hypothetical protein